MYYNAFSASIKAVALCIKIPLNTFYLQLCYHSDLLSGTLSRGSLNVKYYYNILLTFCGKDVKVDFEVKRKRKCVSCTHMLHR